MYFGDAANPNLSGGAGHAGPSDGMCNAANACVGALKDVPGPMQTYSKVFLGTGIPGNEHVVGDEAQTHLFFPHVGPNLCTGVDVVKQGRLGANLRAGGPYFFMAFCTASVSSSRGWLK